MPVRYLFSCSKLQVLQLAAIHEVCNYNRSNIEYDAEKKSTKYSDVLKFRFAGEMQPEKTGFYMDQVIKSMVGEDRGCSVLEILPHLKKNKSSFSYLFYIKPHRDLDQNSVFEICFCCYDYVLFSLSYVWSVLFSLSYV